MITVRLVAAEAADNNEFTSSNTPSRLKDDPWPRIHRSLGYLTYHHETVTG